MHTDCIIARRKSTPDRLPKAIEPQLPAEQTVSYVATAFTGGTGLRVCTNAEARHSTQCVLHYLESLKDVKTEKKVPNHPSLLQTSDFLY
jgi:hypothetical protein